MAATVDVLSNGYLTLGIGAGWFKGEADAYGLAFPDTGERLDRLKNAVDTLKAMLHNSPSNHTGRYYIIIDALNRPQPIQRPHPPIMIGGAGPMTLRIAAREVDIWNCTGVDASRFQQHRLFARYVLPKLRRL